MQNKWKIFLGILFLAAFVLSFYILSENRLVVKEAPGPRVSKVQIDNMHLQFANLSMEELISLSDGIIKTAQYIALAKKHARGTKTADALLSAQKSMIKNLDILNVNYAHVVERTAKPPTSVCPEVFKGRNFGYPVFDTGFVVENCTYGKSLEELITVVFVYENSQTYDVVKLLNSVREYHPKIPIIIGTKSSKILEKIPSSFKNISKFSDLSSKYKIGEIWNKLIKNVKTKYTLIAHDVIWFNHDARLDRLIRIIERLDLSAAGGAFRDINGNWFKGCQQRVRKNFTIVYEAGYDESFDECVFCDHIDGPFVIKTSEIQKIKFNEKILSQGFYEDFFLRLNFKESVVCPDAMFYTNRTERSYNPQDWKSFLKSWSTFKMKFSGREINMPTPSTFSRDNGRGKALTPWSQIENAKVTHAAMDVCANLTLVCEIDSGTVLGSVKFHGVLPWERDADIVFLSKDYNALVKAKSTWKNMGYTAAPENTVKCCWKNSSRPYHGYIGLRSKHWRLEMWGMAFGSSEPKAMHYQPPTMIPIDVKRVRAPRNPGLWARNRYGKEIYQHAQHWGDAGDQNYKVKRFLACVKPGDQDCLDRYNADGNIQFKDPQP